MNILNSIKKNALILSILFISLIVNIGSIFYYFYRFNNLSFVSIFILSLLSLFFFFYFIIYTKDQQEEQSNKIKMSSLLISLLSFSLFFILSKASTDLAVSSPWHFLPPYFFVLLFVLILSLVYFKSRLVVLLYLIFFSVSFFVYQIAFGYDQLLHQRSMIEILKFGFIEPKTFYYIGQYSLEFFFNKLLPFSLENISKSLVPLLSAILIPVSFLFNFRKDEKNINLVLILLLLLPFSIFTYTVPQNLAFLFLTLIIIFSSNDNFLKERYGFPFIFLLSLSAFFIHPISGISALIFFSILLFKKFKKKALVILSYLAQILVLPILLFFVGGSLALPDVSFDFLQPKILGQENVYLNFVYFFFYNRFYIFIFLIIISLYLFIKKKGVNNIFVLNFFALFFSYIISLFVSFPFLSDIDKGSYSNRLLISSLLFLIPAFFNFFSELAAVVLKQKKHFRFYVGIFFALFLLASIYLNYPRKDNYFNSRGYSVSSSDFEAVRLIEDVKINDNYIVLANQQVGAAAIKEFGFKRYYDGWLYYSVQTGGLFYDYYLRMLDKPNRELIEELLSEIGADNAYVVINDYWWAYERIINEMKVEADIYYQVDDGKISIFHFNFRD
ncbi:MAG: hypothetical protein WC280_01110 [Patescibacteria group bacterium]